MAYNEKHHIIPTTVQKNEDFSLANALELSKKESQKYHISDPNTTLAAEEDSFKMLNLKQLQDQLKKLRKELEVAIKDLDFMKAQDLKNKIIQVESLIKSY